MVRTNGAILLVTVAIWLGCRFAGWWQESEAIRVICALLIVLAATATLFNLRRARKPTYPKERIVFTPEGISTYHGPESAVQHIPAGRLHRLTLLRSGDRYKFLLYPDERPAFEFYLIEEPARAQRDFVSDVQEILGIPESKTYRPTAHKQVHVLRQASPPTRYGAESPTTYDITDLRDYRPTHFRRSVRDGKVIVRGGKRGQVTGKQSFEVWPKDGIIKVRPTLLLGKAYSMEGLRTFDHRVDLVAGGSHSFVRGEVWFDTKQGHRVQLFSLSVDLYKTGELIFADMTDDLRYLVTALNKLLDPTH